MTINVVANLYEERKIDKLQKKSLEVDIHDLMK